MAAAAIGISIIVIWFLIDNVPTIVNMIGKATGLRPGDVHSRIKNKLDVIATQLYSANSALNDKDYKTAVAILNEADITLSRIRVEIEENNGKLRQIKLYDILVMTVDAYNTEISRVRTQILKPPEKEAPPEDIEAKVGLLVISVVPTDSTVHIVGAGEFTLEGEAEMQVDLRPGRYPIIVSRKGYYDKTVNVVMKAGEQTPVSVTLTEIYGVPKEDEVIAIPDEVTIPPPLIEPPEEIDEEAGILSVRSTPSARVFIGGVDTGENTPIDFTMKPSTIDVRLSREGYKSESITAYIKKGKTFIIEKELVELIVPDVKYKVSVTTIPAGASVLINRSVYKYRTPTYVILYKGDYLFRVEKEGYESIEELVSLK